MMINLFPSKFRTVGILICVLLVLTVPTFAQDDGIVRPVDPQEPRADGSVIHQVRTGDTFLSILAAYIEVYNVTEEVVLSRNDWRFRPDFIAAGEEIVILPPGSVEPSTGQLTGSGQSAANQPAPAQAQPAEGQAEAAPSDAPAETALDPAELIRPATPTEANALTVLTESDIAGLTPVEAITPFVP